MRIAICGGIGCGKSAVIDYLSKLGYCTCKADEINAELFHDEKYIRLLVAAFPDVQLADGSIDKAKPCFKKSVNRGVVFRIGKPPVILST